MENDQQLMPSLIADPHKRSAKVFLVFHVIISAFIILELLLVLLIGSIAFDQPHLSYAFFLIQYLLSLAVVVSLMVMSIVSYAHKKYTRTLLISGLFVLIIVGYIVIHKIILYG